MDRRDCFSVRPVTKLLLAGGRDIGLGRLLEDQVEDIGSVASLEVIRDIEVREGLARRSAYAVAAFARSRAAARWVRINPSSLESIGSSFRRLYSSAVIACRSEQRPGLNRCPAPPAHEAFRFSLAAQNGQRTHVPALTCPAVGRYVRLHLAHSTTIVAGRSASSAGRLKRAVTNVPPLHEKRSFSSAYASDIPAAAHLLALRWASASETVAHVPAAVVSAAAAR